MNRCRAALLPLLVALLAAGCSGRDRGDPPTAAEPTAVVQGWLDALVPWGFRGAVALRNDAGGDHDRLTSGYGALEPKRGPKGITTDTRFSIGSNTKPLTGLAILLLEDRGKVDVDDRLGDLLDDVPDDKAPITVRQLLTHTSGLETVHGADDEQLTKPEALGRIFGKPLLFTPGDRQEYSNSGFTLLAAIVEAVSGKSYDDFLRSEIFEPTGMTHSGFLGEVVPPGQDEAVGTSPDGDVGGPSTQPPVGWALRGAGGVVTSVSDLVALDDAIAAGSLLSDDAARRWDEPLVELSEGEGEGYGWAISEPAPGVLVRNNAGGGDGSHHVSMWAHQSGDHTRSFVALSADSQISAEDIAQPIQQLLDGEDVPRPPRLRAIDPDELDRATGTYRSAAGAAITVERQGDTLRLVTTDGTAFPDLFPPPDEIPDVAPIDEVVRLVEALDETDLGYRDWLEQQSTELGPLETIEPVGVASTDAEPAAYLRLHFAQGSVLTAWAFTPAGQSMMIELAASPPGVTFRPAVDGAFVSFTVTPTPFADTVSFTGDDVMTIEVDGRTVDYTREG